MGVNDFQITRTMAMTQSRMHYRTVWETGNDFNSHLSVIKTNTSKRTHRDTAS